MSNMFTGKEGTNKTSGRTSVLVKFTISFCVMGIDSPLGNRNKVGFVHVIVDRYDAKLTIWSVAPESRI